MWALREPQNNGCEFLCLVLDVIHLFQAIWGLNSLDFSGYNKIYPDITRFEDFQNCRNYPWPLTGPKLAKNLW